MDLPAREADLCWVSVRGRKPLYQPRNTCVISGRKLSRYGAEAAGQSDSCVQLYVTGLQLRQMHSYKLIGLRNIGYRGVREGHG